MGLYLAVVRRRLAELQDGEHGRMLRRVADEWMTAQNIRNPAAMTRMLAAGFPEIA